VRRTAGFTLIEMLAVVAIFALMAALVAPNLDLLSRRALRRDAEILAARLELARQRSVVTSVPHRVVLDLEDGSWQLQWLQRDTDEPPPPAEEEVLDPAQESLSLDAPPFLEQSYAPLQGPLGRWTALDDDVVFNGVETPQGWIAAGEAYVAFERDGSASYTLIELGNEDGDVLVLEVLPLADTVRFRDAAD